ncbi:MAG: class I SAM-dependent methyltransferase [Pseudonocardiales bacterium]|nr:MAG: class I SAM-dependent methyltransferase [Pseudonocardiales bacterium]
MRAEEWDERYRAAELVWGARPNRWVERELADLPPGRALDLACGEGRNALWLAARGWQVSALDFSAVALDKGRTLESSQDPAAPRVAWVHGDATSYRAGQPFDLVLLCYLHLAPTDWAAALSCAVRALAPGGTLLVIGHDSTNIADGVGGPQDPAVLFTAAEVAADLAGAGAGAGAALVVDRAEAVHRHVDGADRPAIDALLRAHRG